MTGNRTSALVTATVAALGAGLLIVAAPLARGASSVAPPAGSGAAADDAEAGRSPYAGLESRRIKALSPQQIEQLLTGQGMGYAMAAELNGYPGPKHVLELAAELDLSPSQRGAVQASFDRMHAEAVRLGEEIVELEARLDERFAAGSAAVDEIAALLDSLGGLQALLRLTHLRAHLEMKEVLSASQVDRYIHLRGYAGSNGEPLHHGHHPRR